MLTLVPPIFTVVQEFLNKTPFLRFFLPTVVGIAFAITFNINSETFLYIATAYSLLIIILFILTNRKQNFLNLLFAILTNVLFFIIGVESCYLRTETNDNHHYSKNLDEKEHTYVGYIKELPEEKTKTTKCIIQLLAEYNNTTFVPINGTLLTYIEKDPATLLKFGDKLIFNSKLQEFKSPTNPLEFNYKRYLSFKGISHQAYLKRDQYVIDGKYSSNFIFDFAINLRETLLKTLKENGLGGDEFGIAAALLLGYDEAISDDLMTSYSHTGTLHVLSVSGLHVGILFLALNLLLRFPDRKPYKQIKILAIIALLWFYAMLSGLSPSVVRATIMFSFVLIGNLINRKGQILNTLFASALFMLLYNPFLLIDAGFQLSYLAVASIVIYYPIISKWYLPQNKISNTLWQMFAVSLSAQMLTLPITLYYFHQIPLLFFVANVVVIPLSYGVMFGAVLIIIFSKIKLIASWIAWFVGKIVFIMNWFTIHLDQISFSNISGIQTGIVDMILLFCLIATLTYAFINKNYKAFIASGAIIISLLSIDIYYQIKANQQIKIITYNFHKETATQLIAGTSGIVLTDTLNLRSQNVINTYALSNKISVFKQQKMEAGLYFFTFSGNKMAYLIKDTLSRYDIKDHLDYLILAENPRIKGIQKIDADKIIVDGSNDNKTLNFIKKQFNENGADKVWFTEEKGAYLTETNEN